jgi:tetratricopeptide (TPR) repeat protein
MRVFLFLLVFTGFSAAGLQAESLPEWLIPLREAVYEQRLTASEVTPLYRAAKTAAIAYCSGTALDLALSRCEYFMGRVFQFENRNADAADHYAEGMRLAERATQANPSAGAWLLLAENLSQSCAVRSTAFAMANGLNVEKYAKNALALNSRNAAAQYIVAARWVYAPAPLNNLRRGIEMMEAITTAGDMEKDDRFNGYSAIGYAYIQQRRHADARPWLLRALEVYPSNKFARELLDTRS